MAGTPYILGTDVGGTFTDLMLITDTGELHCFKVPSTPSRPGASILGGIDEIRETLGPDYASWRGNIHTHSSTIATNALIERRGAAIGLLVSAGLARPRSALHHYGHSERLACALEADILGRLSSPEWVAFCRSAWGAGMPRYRTFAQARLLGHSIASDWLATEVSPSLAGETRHVL